MFNEYVSADEMWGDLCEKLFTCGSVHTSRRGATREITGYVARIKDPKSCVVWNNRRNFSPTYACGELMWYLSGSDSGEFIRHYAPSYDQFLNGGRAHGAYGRRWAKWQQVELCLNLLREKSNTRQAVMTCWEPGDLQVALDGEMRDVPCTLSLHWIVRDGKLNLIVTMRSNDAWLGTPNDVFAFCMLQRLFADELSMDVGFYQHQVGSMHVYERDFIKMIEAQSVRMPYRSDPLEFVERNELEPDWDIALDFEAAFRERAGGTPKHNLMTIRQELGQSALACVIAMASLKNRESLFQEEQDELVKLIPERFYRRCELCS